MKGKLITLAVALSFSATGAVAKQTESQRLAEPNFYGTTVSFSTGRALSSGAEITIAGPGNFRAIKASKFGLPSVQLANYGYVADGKYNYRIVVKSGPRVKLVDNGMNNGRDPYKEYYGVKGTVETGHFLVKNGNIQNFDKNLKEAQRK